jgi:hypothetical protein
MLSGGASGRRNWFGVKVRGELRLAIGLGLAFSCPYYLVLGYVPHGWCLLGLFMFIYYYWFFSTESVIHQKVSPICITSILKE